jgi:hypothetical protein
MHRDSSDFYRDLNHDIERRLDRDLHRERRRRETRLTSEDQSERMLFAAGMAFVSVEEES